MTDHKHEVLKAKHIDELIAVTANVVKVQIQYIAVKLKATGGNDDLRPCELSLPIRTLDALSKLRIALFGGVGPASDQEWYDPAKLEETIAQVEGEANRVLDSGSTDPGD